MSAKPNHLLRKIMVLQLWDKQLRVLLIRMVRFFFCFITLFVYGESIGFFHHGKLRRVINIAFHNVPNLIGKLQNNRSYG